MSEIHQEPDGPSPIDPALIYVHTKYSLGDRIITVMYAEKGEGEDGHVLFRGSEAGSYVHPKTGQQIDFQYGFFLDAKTLTQAFEMYEEVSAAKLEKHIKTIDAEVERELLKAQQAQQRIQTDPRWADMLSQLPAPKGKGKKRRK